VTTSIVKPLSAAAQQRGVADPLARRKILAFLRFEIATTPKAGGVGEGASGRLTPGRWAAQDLNAYARPEVV
jgi:hypothetical protein